MRSLFHTTLALCVFALSGCLSDSTVQPIDEPAASVPREHREATAPTDASWEDELRALAAREGAEDLLADMEPLLEEARRVLDGRGFRDPDAELFLAYETTTFVVVPPFPPPVLHLEITFDGISTHGSYTGFSLSMVDVTVEPNVQTGNQTDTYDATGDELVVAYEGVAVPGAGEGDVVFYGSSNIIDGTGEFADASGMIWYVGRANQIEAVGEVLRFGLISPEDDD